MVHCGWEYAPTGITAAQMSIPYGVARVLVDGKLSAADFEPNAIGEPRVLDMTKRVRVVPDDDLDKLGPSRRYAVRSRLQLTDGRVFEDRVEDRPGNSTSPLPAAQIEAKFFDLADRALGNERSAHLRQLISDLDQLDRATTLSTALSLSAAPLTTAPPEDQ
jgi:2-methylcitrate dehydratase PrpD